METTGILAVAYVMLLVTPFAYVGPVTQRLLDHLREHLAAARGLDADDVERRCVALATTIRYAAPERIDEIMGMLLEGDW